MANDPINNIPEQKPYIGIGPFKLQIIQSFPFIEADFDAITNQQLLQKVVDYLNKVIQNTNAVTDNTTALYNAFVELENYVNNYFQNLNVQDEINNKLDDMTEDGTLTELIKKYVDPIYQNYQNQINKEISDQNILINQINQKVTSSTTSTPIAVNSISQMTDTSKIYVLTTDGKWYYYSGSTWVAGGVYQATSIGSGQVRYYNLNQNIIGNNFVINNNATVNPGILFNLSQTYRASDSNPLSIRLKLKIKTNKNPVGNFGFFGQIQNQSEHTVSLQYVGFLTSIFNSINNEMEIDRTFNFNFNFNGFKLGLDYNTISSGLQIDIKNIELYINNELVDFTYDSLWPLNQYVTNNSLELSPLATQEMLKEISNKNVSYKELDNNIVGNIFKISGSAAYPGIRLLIPATFYNNQDPINIHIKFDLQNGNTIPNNSSFLIRYGRLAASSIDYDTHINLMSIKQEVDINFDATTSINFLAIQINNNNLSYKYDFYLSNIKIYINNELINYIWDNTLNTITTNISIPLNYLATQDSVQNLLYNSNTAQFLDAFTKSNKFKIACWGDSLTEGGTSEGQPYPTILQNLLGNNYIVSNLGKSGQRSGLIAFRQGGNKFTIIENIQLPASNETTVTFTCKISSGYVSNIGTYNNLDASINGIKGKFSITAINQNANTLSCSFKRNENGESQNVTENTQVISTQDTYGDNTSLIWFGINDITFSGMYATSGPTENMLAMINHMSTNIKRFLILGTCTTASMTPNSSMFNLVNTLNTLYQKYYPNEFVDMNNYCVNNLIYDMGLTPTAKDLENINNGIIPPSVTADGIHFTGDARVYIAQFIYNELCLRDWI